MATVVFEGGKVWDGSGKPAFPADVLIAGNRIAECSGPAGWTPGRKANRHLGPHRHSGPGRRSRASAVPAQGRHRRHRGRPARRAHAATRRHARIVLEAGFTSCLSGGSAKPRLDVVDPQRDQCRGIPGPRMLAASPELTNTGNLGDERRMHIYRESIAMVVDGVDEMPRTCRSSAARGSGHDQAEHLGKSDHPGLASAPDDHARRRGAHGRANRACARQAHRGPRPRCGIDQAGARDSEIDILYHCEYADEECLDLLEAARDRIFVAPAIGLLHNTDLRSRAVGHHLRESEAATGWWISSSARRKCSPSCASARVRVLVGGDYGFPWTPHGTNARDLEHFVRFFGYSDAEALVAATRTGAAAMMLEGQAGEMAKGFLPIWWWWPANRRTTSGCCRVPGNIKLVMKDGRIHKNLFRWTRMTGSRDAPAHDPVPGRCQTRGRGGARGSGEERLGGRHRGRWTMAGI